jgi:hypothetical protein
MVGGLEDGHPLPADAVVIDNHRDLAVGVQRLELIGELVGRPDVDPVEVIGQARLLQHHQDLQHVGAGDTVEINHRCKLH